MGGSGGGTASVSLSQSIAFVNFTNVTWCEVVSGSLRWLQTLDIERIWQWLPCVSVVAF